MSDDFSEAVKRVLAHRVGNHCSNPDCRASTSGPQDDPTKAVNLGVAAHITAASAGGPRYDLELLPEERSGPSNGIWLCQNCAKLIDNDPARSSVEILRKWKSHAEAEAKAHVGKTALIDRGPRISLGKYSRVQITPIIPTDQQEAIFMLLDDSGEKFNFQKTDSGRYVDIPKSFVERIHTYGDSRPGLLQLAGRLQWLSKKRDFALFPEKPAPGPEGAYGVPKDIDPTYVRTLGIVGSFAREERIPALLSQGWAVFYDSDGKYLRWPGRDVNQILICPQVSRTAVAYRS